MNISTSISHLHLAIAVLLFQASSAFLKKEDVGKNTCSKGGGKCAGKKATPEFWKKDSPEEKDDRLDEKYTGRVAMEIIAKLNTTKHRVIDQKCSELSGICYEVTDEFLKDGMEHGFNEWEIIRTIRAKGFEQPAVAEASLIKPKKLIWRTFDTKQWPVLKRAVFPRYAQYMITSAVASHAIPMNASEVQKDVYNVLVIGLRGDVVGSFIARRPYVNVTVVEEDSLMIALAEKWFAFRRTPNLHVVRGDGAEFIHEAQKRGTQYDAIFIDSCYHRKTTHRCPVDEFKKRHVIESYKKLLTATGVAIINTKSADLAYEKNLMTAHAAVFPVCFRYPDEGDDKPDHVVVCYNRPGRSIWTSNEDRTNFVYRGAEDFFFLTA